MTRTHTTRGPLALLAARLATLPEGEHVIVIDTRQPGRPRWRIAACGKWETPREQEKPEQEAQPQPCRT
jgi:hypothetical protein